ncbi:MAG: alpha/beta hydrolase [Rikenellaceae bacterium]
MSLLSLATGIIAQEVSIFPDGYLKEPIEYVESDDCSGGPVGGLSVCRKSNVGEPTFTLYRAAKPNGREVTVVVCPGGGYNILAYDLEGSEICQLLNESGYNAVLLKYRVPRRPSREKHEAPLEDLQRTISLLRSNAAEYGINGGRIGVVGFSAGAHLAVMSCCNERSYTSIDAADELSCRPDFCSLIYPAYLSGENFKLADDVSVTPSTPPTFISQSEDDKNHINSSLFYCYALKEAAVPATLHIYSSGGHGYGVRQTGQPSQAWGSEFLKWLDQQ